jgi:hypothetical protein
VAEPDLRADEPRLGDGAPSGTGTDGAATGEPGVQANELAAAPDVADVSIVADHVGTADVAPEPVAPAPPAIPPIVDVADLDWAAIRDAVIESGVRARMRDTVERMEALLDQQHGPGLLFDTERDGADDRAIRVGTLSSDAPLWFIGDLHGDLLALEAALALARRDAGHGPPPRFVLLGDLFDDGGYGLEVLLCVFELILESPAHVCFVAGNHDEALAYTGAGFTAAVSPSDFSDFLNGQLAHEWITRAGKLAVRLAASAPRALFLPDGLLVTHGGFPLVDLHGMLRETRNWNDPRCLTDFTWTRAHPRARKKLPNRSSRGSQFGHEDFAAFCALATELERPVTHMVRGHDHVDERFEIPPAYAAHPVLTTVALSRRLPRELFGPHVRVPTVARWVERALPQVHRLLVPDPIVRELFPEEIEPDAPVGADVGGATDGGAR